MWHVNCPAAGAAQLLGKISMVASDPSGLSREIQRRPTKISRRASCPSSVSINLISISLFSRRLYAGVWVVVHSPHASYITGHPQATQRLFEPHQRPQSIASMLLGGDYPLRFTRYPLSPPVATAHSLGNFMRSQPTSRPADQMQPQLLAGTTLLDPKHSCVDLSL